MGCRREEFEALRHTPILAINDKWAIPLASKTTVGAKMLTRKKRWTFDVRWHGRRRNSKKGRKR